MRNIAFICSPLSANGGTCSVEDNQAYARLCMRHSIDSGEAPMVPHLLYTQVLDDTIDGHRAAAIECAERFIRALAHTSAGVLAVYSDYGITQGMASEIELASKVGLPIKIRKLQGVVSGDV